VGSDINMQKFLIISCLAVAAQATPDSLATPYAYVHYPGIAHHPGHATSFVATSPHGLRYHGYGKRSAEAESEAEAEAEAKTAPIAVALHTPILGHVVGLDLNNLHGPNIHLGTGYGVSQLHPSGHSYQHVSRLHKREGDAEGEGEAEAEADAEAEAETEADSKPVAVALPLTFYRPIIGHVFGHSGYGLNQLHPRGHSYQHVSRLHKREGEAEGESEADAEGEAEAETEADSKLVAVALPLAFYRPIIGHSGYGLSQLHPSGHSYQHVSRLHRREADSDSEGDAEAEAEVDSKPIAVALPVALYRPILGHVVGLDINNVYGPNHLINTGYGVSQLHPSGRSYQHVSRLHKREADAEAYYGYYGHGYGHGHGLGYHHSLGHIHGRHYGYGYSYGYHG